MIDATLDGIDQKRIYTKEDVEGLCAIAIAAYRKAAILKGVDRFLAWPLPDSVCSDGCVTQRDYGVAHGLPKRLGTNLLNAEEARKMLEHVIAPLPQVERVASEMRRTDDPGMVKILTDLLDRMYKINLMAIPALRVTEQNPDHDDPLVAWMSDVRSVLYRNKAVPDPIRDLQGKTDG